MNLDPSGLTEYVDIEIDDFEELVFFYCERPIKFFASRLSTNPDGEIWTPDSKGWTKEAFRNYYRDAPRMILVAAETYRSFFREEGGRFWIDWHGAYPMTDRNQYFVKWKKSMSLRNYVSERRSRYEFNSFHGSIFWRLSNE